MQVTEDCTCLQATLLAEVVPWSLPPLFFRGEQYYPRMIMLNFTSDNYPKKKKITYNTADRIGIYICWRFMDSRIRLISFLIYGILFFRWDAFVHFGGKILMVALLSCPRKNRFILWHIFKHVISNMPISIAPLSPILKHTIGENIH